MKKLFALALFACVIASWWSWQRSPLSTVPLEPDSKTVASSPASIQAGQTNIPGIGPVPTDPKELIKFKAKTKRELQVSMRTMGVFSNRDDMKLAQDSGELAWIFIEQRKNLQLAMDHIHGAAVEPYPPRMLEALEHILKHAETPQLRLAAAVLLFRYDQPAGKAYLLNELNVTNPDLLTRQVILTLAQNQVPQAVPGIVAAFPKTGPPADSILIALGRWTDPAISQLLRQRYAGDQRNWGYALALSQASDPTVIAPLTVALTRNGGSSDGYLIRAGLAHLGDVDPTVWETNMQTAWENRLSLSETALLRYLDVAGAAVAKSVAQDWLKACIPLHEAYVAGMESQAKGIREKIPELANKFPKPPPSEFIMGAAQLLAQWDAKEAVPTLQQVLTTVQKGNRSDVYLNEALGLALYKLDPLNWRTTMLNAGIPFYHVDRIPELAKLRPIPAEYMPKQVNLKAR